MSHGGLYPSPLPGKQTTSQEASAFCRPLIPDTPCFLPDNRSRMPDRRFCKYFRTIPLHFSLKYLLWRKGRGFMSRLRVNVLSGHRMSSVSSPPEPHGRTAHRGHRGALVSMIPDRRPSRNGRRGLHMAETWSTHRGWWGQAGPAQWPGHAGRPVRADTLHRNSCPFVFPRREQGPWPGPRRHSGTRL